MIFSNEEAARHMRELFAKYLEAKRTSERTGEGLYSCLFDGGFMELCETTFEQYIPPRKFHPSVEPCEEFGFAHECYKCACAVNAEDQGVNRIAMRLEEAGIPCVIEQTGGMTMVCYAGDRNGKHFMINSDGAAMVEPCAQATQKAMRKNWLTEHFGRCVPFGRSTTTRMSTRVTAICSSRICCMASLNDADFTAPSRSFVQHARKWRTLKRCTRKLHRLDLSICQTRLTMASTSRRAMIDGA